MTDRVDLEAIEARAASATRGPWTQRHRDIGVEGPNYLQTLAWTARLADEGTVGVRSVADAEFIAHARTDVPALVAEVRALRARIEDHHCGGRAAAGE
jgi:hypothetical protein